MSVDKELIFLPTPTDYKWLVQDKLGMAAINLLRYLGFKLAITTPELELGESSSLLSLDWRLFAADNSYIWADLTLPESQFNEQGIMLSILIRSILSQEPFSHGLHKEAHLVDRMLNYYALYTSWADRLDFVRLLLGIDLEDSRIYSIEY